VEKIGNLARIKIGLFLLLIIALNLLILITVPLKPSLNPLA